MKRKIIINFLFKIVIILILLVSICLNNDYKDIHNRLIINNKETLDKYKDNKFVTLDLSNANVTRLNVLKDDEYNTYILTLDDVDVLVELTKGTVVTGELNVMKMSDTTAELDVKATFNGENKTNFMKGYYTNKNLMSNEKTINIIIYITFGFIGFLFILIIVDIIKLFKKNNTTNM